MEKTGEAFFQASELYLHREKKTGRHGDAPKEFCGEENSPEMLSRVKIQMYLDSQKTFSSIATDDLRTMKLQTSFETVTAYCAYISLHQLFAKLWVDVVLILLPSLARGSMLPGSVDLQECRTLVWAKSRKEFCVLLISNFVPLCGVDVTNAIILRCQKF